MTEWPADKVKRWPVERLIPYARNARTHDEAQVAQIAASIREWGWTTPILVDPNGMIIAGHGRVLAARKLGLVDVPVMVAGNWSEAQKRAYVLADNKIALNAGWDDALLGLELTDLSGMGVDLDLVGFTEREFAALTASNNPGLTDPDESPEPPVTPVSRLGDAWLLGQHRLVCGDCTDAAIVANAQAVEHYEMCRYGTLIAWAEELGHDEIVRFLTTNLNEEKAANTKLNTVALRKGVNAKASTAAG